MDTFNFYLYDRLRSCSYTPIAEVAEKSIKEIAYHAQWSAEWVVRLGDVQKKAARRFRKALMTCGCGPENCLRPLYL